jgi:thiopeptide-type bacteriocin biosynthesis protein
VNCDGNSQGAAPLWMQVSVQFDDYAAAENIGVAHLGPVMAEAEAAGLVSSWSFIRKAPCWRVRYHADRDGQSFVHKALDTLRMSGHIAQWVETIYEPEVHAFGGTAGMDVAHHLFHQDSRHLVAYLGGDGLSSSRGDKRRELSILLCSTLMRGAGQDWYEQGDLWARVAENRPSLPEMPSHRERGTESSLRRLMTVDASPASPLTAQNGALNHLAAWFAAFDSAGMALGDLARDGTLHRGVRAVLAHHVIFHWNRIGLPYEVQSVLAHAAKAVVLGD